MVSLRTLVLIAMQSNLLDATKNRSRNPEKCTVWMDLKEIVLHVNYRNLGKRRIPR